MVALNAVVDGFVEASEEGYSPGPWVNDIKAQIAKLQSTVQNVVPPECIRHGVDHPDARH